jgi:hypothetical protein
MSKIIKVKSHERSSKKLDAKRIVDFEKEKLLKYLENIQITQKTYRLF